MYMDSLVGIAEWRIVDEEMFLANWNLSQDCKKLTNNLSLDYILNSSLSQEFFILEQKQYFVLPIKNKIKNKLKCDKYHLFTL